MGYPTVYDRFAAELEKGCGLPDGRTVEVVQERLRTVHRRVFDALNLYDKALNYQNKDWELKAAFGDTNREAGYAVLLVRFVSSSGEIPMPIVLLERGIESKFDQLTNISLNKDGKWSIDETNDFCEFFGHALLRVVGATR